MSGVAPQDEEWMKQAIQLSIEKMQAGEGGPFGAVVVKDGRVIAEGWNQVTSTNDPTAHAEVQAIRKACKALGDFSMEGCTLYSSCEPCPMCLSAIYWSRTSRLYFAAGREDAAAVGFDDAFLYDEVPKKIGDRTMPTSQFLREEAQEAFRQWREKEDSTHY